MTRRLASAAAAAALIAAALFGYAAEPTEGEKNYFVLHDLYLDWTNALFGSRHYHEQKLKDFLVQMLGRQVTTGHDFMLSSPEGVIDKTMVCVFRNTNWLYVHGELDDASLKLLSESGFEALKAWWRSGVLVALSGKVKFFKLDRDARGGDIVHLYLEKISVLK